MTDRVTAISLPRAAPARVLACGAFLKNTAARLEGASLRLSALHDDLSDPAACAALERSLHALRGAGSVDAVAHDRHPDFPSTRLAQRLAGELGVPAIGVQHHHAHLAVVQAEQGWRDGALVGLAFDGAGWGDDGTAWGGEVLVLRGACAERVDHLPPLALPGGDAAAREPWRLAASLLHAVGRGDEIEPRFAPQVGVALARGVRTMLERDLHCPRSTAAGRWFDAAAGALGVSLRQSHEAEAAMTLEALAARVPAQDCLADERDMPSLDLRPLVAGFFDVPPAGRPAAAARLHHALAAGAVAAAVRAAQAAGTDRVALGGGCFANRLLSTAIERGLRAAGLRVARPQAVACGDAGLALGQAWAAALAVAAA